MISQSNMTEPNIEVMLQKIKNY